MNICILSHIPLIKYYAPLLLKHGPLFVFYLCNRSQNGFFSLSWSRTPPFRKHDLCLAALQWFYNVCLSLHACHLLACVFVCVRVFACMCVCVCVRVSVCVPLRNACITWCMCLYLCLCLCLRLRLDHRLRLRPCLCLCLSRCSYFSLCGLRVVVPVSLSLVCVSVHAWQAKINSFIAAALLIDIGFCTMHVVR